LRWYSSRWSQEVEGVLGRRFPIHDEGGAPTGKLRQLQYKLTAGEVSRP